VPSTPNPALQAVEAEVQSHSTALRKELGLLDLVLAQLLIIIVADYMGTAVKAGPSHVVFWLLAILTFFTPAALVVMHLACCPLKAVYTSGRALPSTIRSVSSSRGICGFTSFFMWDWEVL
jgi:hypothetical protein